MLDVKRSNNHLGEDPVLAFHSIWSYAKRWRRIPLGPVSLIFRADRTVRISNNVRRRLIRQLRESIHRNRDPRPVPTRVSSGKADKCGGQADRPNTALIVGVGPGLGFALARKFAESDMHVALAARNAERLDPLVGELRMLSKRRILAYGCDATDEISVKTFMSQVSKDFPSPELVVYCVQAFCPGKTVDTELAAFETCWRHNCLGGFIVGREVARSMIPARRGTIVLVGSTSGMIGRADHLNLAVGKFGLRALSQVMARELWPYGIHVVHLVIDADIKENEEFDSTIPQADPEHIADLVYMLYRQPASSWTSELDVRPYNETFWQHC
jgi:NAD(P)-dependent dehydrogenase (short-subunit alcohol dehydrogenase family)